MKFQVFIHAIFERLSFLGLLCLALSQPGQAESKIRIEIKGAQIEATLNDGTLAISEAELTHWIRNAAEAVITYYGRFPVSHLEIQVNPFSGKGVRSGKTFARRGGLIRIAVGSETTVQDLADDWMMTHEMVHLTFPDVPEQHHWIEEGIATYVEPIARIQAGQVDAKSMWADLVRDMPKGLPGPGDEGLDRTHTWARTYWGGALFCFNADIEIRRETKNRMGLQDALRGILNAGGNMMHDWQVEEAFRAGDRATGTHVLMNLYSEMRDKPVKSDLQKLWEQLGVQQTDSGLQLKNDAELSVIRLAITRAPGK